MAGSLSQDEGLSVVAARNTVAASALRMIQALATGAGGVGVFVKQTQDFQSAWNTALPHLGPLLIASMQVDTGSAAEEVLYKGLVTDGKYGLKTGIAMLMAILASTDVKPPASLFETNGPPRVQDMPTWFTGANRDYINQALIQVTIDSPLPEPVVAPVSPAPNPPIQDLIVEAQQGNLPSQIDKQATSAQQETVVTFEEGSVVTAKVRKSSSTFLIVGGAGLAVAAGAFWWTTRGRR